MNRAGLTSSEMAPSKLAGRTREEIEDGIMKEALAGYSVDPSYDPALRAEIADSLAGEGGLKTARKLLTALAQEAKDNERKEAFRNRMVREAKEAMGQEVA